MQKKLLEDGTGETEEEAFFGQNLKPEVGSASAI
jgi:hypothetical protein